MATGVNGLQTSPEGVNWTYREQGTVQDLVSTAFGNAAYVTLGGLGQGVLLRSPDAVNNWEFTLTSVNYPGTGVAYGNGVFIALFGPTIRSTTDGRDFTLLTNPSEKGLNDVDYGGGRFVAVGEEGAIVRSDQGTTWVNVTSPTTTTLNAVTYGGGRYVAVGQQGTVLTSTDGATWTSQTPATTVNLRGVAYGNGFYVAVGDSGRIQSSPDGADWTPRPSGTTVTLHDVAYGLGRWVTVGNGGTIRTSP